MKKSEDPALRLTMLQALHGVTQECGQRMSEKHRGEILETLQALEGTLQETNRLEAALCLGTLCTHLPDQNLEDLLKGTVFVSEGVSDWAVLQARSTALSAALKSAGERISRLGLGREAREAVLTFATSDRVSVDGRGTRKRRWLHALFSFRFLSVSVDCSVQEATSTTCRKIAHG